MVICVQINRKWRYLIWHYWLLVFKAFAEASAKYLTRNHQFIPCELRIRRIPIRINIDQFHDPVTVRAGRGGEQMRHDVAGYSQIFLEWTGGPSQCIWTDRKSTRLNSSHI